MACLRLFTFPPLPPGPLRALPRLNSCISFSTSFEALGLYFLRLVLLVRDRVDFFFVVGISLPL
jgi:hypothetical protein